MSFKLVSFFTFIDWRRRPECACCEDQTLQSSLNLNLID